MRNAAKISEALIDAGWEVASTSGRLLSRDGVSLYLGHEDGEDGCMDTAAGRDGGAWFVSFNADVPANVVVAAALSAAVRVSPEGTETP